MKKHCTVLLLTLFALLFLQISPLMAQQKNFSVAQSARLLAATKSKVAKSLSASNARTLSCGSDSVVLTRQSQIDSFPITHAGCTILRELRIYGDGASPAITNLDSLYGITEITGFFEIDHTSLTNLSGLSGLQRTAWLWLGYNPLMTDIRLPNATDIGSVLLNELPSFNSFAGFTQALTTTRLGYLWIFNNVPITDFNGLQSLDTIENIGVFGLPALQTMNGLQNVVFCHDIGLHGCGALTDVSALGGITELDYGSLKVNYNGSLSSWTGLHNITRIGGILEVQGSPFTSLNGLNPNLFIENVNNSSDTLRLEWNYQLAACSFAPLCDYLSRSGAAIIHDNDVGCNSIAEINNACGTGLVCTSRSLRTWNASVNDEWTEPQNWTPVGVPLVCDSVVIPNTALLRPRLLGNTEIGALTMENGTELYLAGYGLTVNGDTYLDAVLMGGGTYLNIYRAKSIDITGSNFYINHITIRNVIGTSNLTYNSIHSFNNAGTTVKFADSIGRTGDINFYSNYISGDFELTHNTAEPFTNTAMGGDEITGNTNFVLNSTEYIAVGGLYDKIKLGGNLTVFSNHYLPPVLGGIELNGGGDMHIIKLGTPGPVYIENLALEKSGNILLDQDVHVLYDARFGFGVVKSEPGKMLVFDHGSGISQTSSASYVHGPVKKLGLNPFQRFIFPVADSIYQGGAFVQNPSGQTINDEFIAKYFHRNPSVDGYDTSLKAANFPLVSGNEYWQIDHAEGPANARTNNAVLSNPVNVHVGLSYDSTHSMRALNPFTGIYSLRVARWDSGVWKEEGTAFVDGNSRHAFPFTKSPVSGFGIFTLGYEPSYLPSVTVVQVAPIICGGDVVKVHYTVSDSFLLNNQFKAQLSDTAGSFVTNTQIGSILQSTSDSITAYIPYNLAASGNYKIRVVGTHPPIVSTNSVAVAYQKAPQLFYSISGPSSACVNTTYKYYAAQREAGVAYTWSLTQGTATLNAADDTVYVTPTAAGTIVLRLVASNTCGSRQAQITIGSLPPPPTGTPTLNNIGRWLYASTPLAAGASAYHWARNDTIISGATASSYYASAAGNYTAAFANSCGGGPVSNTISFTAASLPQTINFPVIADKVFTDAPFNLNATTSSGLPVQYNLVSGPGSISGSTYTITGTGTVTIRAFQLGDNVYDTAAPVTMTFAVNKGSQTITFPSIADQTLGTAAIALTAVSSSGLPITYSVVSGPASISGSTLFFTNVGSVTVRASQAGNSNYLAATPVDITFCVNPTSLQTMAGPQFICPGQTATYSINYIPGVTYHWRLSNGTTFPATTNSVSFSIGNSGTYTLLVSASGPCGTATADVSFTIHVVTAVTPAAVSNMLPANGATGLALPLQLSWLPGNNALTYDLYIWESEAAQPSTPFAANLTSVSYTISANALAYNKAYKWRLVSKNACLQTAGPVQEFTLKPLPDLVVSQVQIPASAFSGQMVSFSWRVTNNGPGNTTTNQRWNDAVFLSFDTLPNFFLPPNTNPAAWNALEFPVKPLLIGTRQNVSALDAGQHYDNTLNFTLPLNYSQPLYVYVIANYQPAANAPLEMTMTNNTARASDSVHVILSPTPDLRVDTVVTPSSVFSGSTINLSYKVKNYGVLTPSGSGWTDKFYISQSPLFNSHTAIPLKLPKANGSYYPDAVDASFSNSVQLQADSSYSRSVQLVVPNFIFGSYFIYVVTNTNHGVYEGALAINNIGSSPLQVFLTPTPQLKVHSLTVPLSTASTTQPIDINWLVVNSGFNNNIEKNKGHYFVVGGDCQIPPPPCPPGPPGSVCYQPPPTPGKVYKDSLGFGGSYWVDKVYLSTDASGLNSNAVFIGNVPGGVQYSGLLSPETAQADKCLPPGTVGTQSNINTSNVILPGSNHPATYKFAVPANLLPGNYYVYVAANADKDVYEYPGTLQVKRSDHAIAITRPDLSVSAPTVAPTSIGGQPVKINYEVKNLGSGSVFNGRRVDQIYVSTSPTLDGTAQLLKATLITENIPAGGSANHTYSHTFTPGTSGVRYFFVVVNYDSSLLKETAYTNNASAPASTMFSTAVPTDLLVSQFIIADSVSTLTNTYVKYAVVNNGTGTTAGVWMDSLYISCSPVFNSATSFYIGRRQHNKTLANGEGYSDSFQVYMPLSYHINDCFPGTTYSTVYFFLKTNADNTVYEGSNMANNVLASGARVLINPLVDHVVTTVSGTDLAMVARPYTVSWTVRNNGFSPPYPNYAVWYDGVYFSVDSVFSANDIRVEYNYETQVLPTNQTYTRTKSIVLPNMAEGSYYVIVVSNAGQNIMAEKVMSNNHNLLRNTDGSARLVQVTKPALPDFTDTLLTAPMAVAIGQPLTVVHQVMNRGAGASFPEKWSSELWLSADFVPGNAGDIRLAAKNFSVILTPSQTLTDTVTGNIALDVPAGNYILISSVDAVNNIVETADSNNLAFGFVNVFKPAPADLLVQQILKPDTVYLGYSMDTVKWVVANNSPNKAEGVSSDGIYLARSTTLDSTATLLGVVSKQINIAALGSDTQTLQPMVSNVPEGDYHLLVRTDLLNNIVESDKTNNVGVAVGSIYVKVKELLLNRPETNTLHRINRLYKLVIPDSLNGATILVTLKTPDSLTVRNEMFIGQGFVPTPASFTYRFETANYGNQQIVMSSTAKGVYYILVRTVTPTALVQNITLNAVKLPFAILNVQSSQGGNIGNVTVKISGSLFTANMTAKLVRGGTTITASQVYFTNSTQVYATFNLQSATLGLYDVVLTKPDTTIASLANAFSVVPANNGGLITGSGPNTGSGNGAQPGCDPGAASGLNSQLVTELIIPEKVFAGWPFVVQINYSNPTNYDVPAQVRILYNDKGLPVALTSAALDDTKTSLYLELTEQGGPPGVIRAGGSGTITVYSKAPVTMPGHTFVKFNLK
jgi:hypothetical protein